MVFVNGYNGLGIHTLLSVVRLFGRDVKNYVFVQIGVVDGGVFKGAAELPRLKAAMERDLYSYEEAMRRRGYYAESLWAVGTDIVHEVLELAPALAVDDFRLAVSVARPATQIHTHMCYAEFNEIVPSIAAMDADVISIEASRSRMELLTAFADFRYPNEMGPGLYDIQCTKDVSPAISLPACPEWVADSLWPWPSVFPWVWLRVAYPGFPTCFRHW